MGLDGKVGRALFKGVTATVSGPLSAKGRTVTQNELLAARLALGVDGFTPADERLLWDTFSSKTLGEGTLALLRKFTPSVDHF